MSYTVTEVTKVRPRMGGGDGPFRFSIQEANPNRALCVTFTYNTQEEADLAREAAHNMIANAVTVSAL